MFGIVVYNMWDTLVKINEMVLANIDGKMGAFILGNGKMAICMVLAAIYGPIKDHIWGVGFRERCMDLGFINGLMESDMKDTFRIIEGMGKAFFIH